jgi:hypothetical protein
MPMFDRWRFLKILNLTESPNDFEALNAVRRANAMLHAAGLSWEKLIVVPPPPDAEPKPAEEREDPLWADAWMLTPGNWPADPMRPLGKRNAEEQTHARLGSAASWLRLAFCRGWTAAVTFVTGRISRLRKVGGTVGDEYARTLKEALLRLKERVVRLERWVRFKRRSGG